MNVTHFRRGLTFSVSWQHRREYAPLINAAYVIVGLAVMGTIVGAIQG